MNKLGFLQYILQFSLTLAMDVTSKLFNTFKIVEYLCDN